MILTLLNVTILIDKRSSKKWRGLYMDMRTVKYDDFTISIQFSLLSFFHYVVNPRHKR